MNHAELKRRISFARTQQERADLLALANVGPQQIAAAFRIWELHAPYKLQGMLTGNGWMWDSRIQGYRSTATNKVIAGADLKKLALEISDAIKEDMRKKSHKMLIIPLFVWKHQFALDVAAAFTLMAMLAAGGETNLTQRMRKAVTGKPKVPGGLAFSMDRLARWGRQLKADEEGDSEPSGMSPENRAELYGDSATAMLETIRSISHDDARDDNGKRVFQFYRNVLDPACKNHCRDTQYTDGCPSVTKAGWRPIGTLPECGLRTCGPRCRCGWEFSYVGPEEKPSGN